MTLLDDTRLSLRLTTQALDGEVEMLIDYAIADMERVGVDPDLLPAGADDEASSSMVKNAIITYAKAHFGFDNAEMAQFDDSYRRIVCDLMNSSANIAAKEATSEAEL